MTSLANDISDIEERLKAAGVPLDRFFKRANIHYTTWFRWKSGDHGPTLKNWRRAVDVVDGLVAEAAQEALEHDQTTSVA